MTDQIDPRRVDWIVTQLREKVEDAPGATRRGVMREAADLLTSLRQQVETLTQALDRAEDGRAETWRLLDAASDRIASLAAAQERLVKHWEAAARFRHDHADNEPDCDVASAHRNWAMAYEVCIEQLKAALALPSLAASSRETTKDDDTRQSSPSPVREPGSPRSQSGGSE